MYVHWMTAPLIWNWSRKQATTCRLFSVKKRHAENVPDKLSEQEFWTRFFQSHYFHRDRIAFAKEDLFAECASSDDKGLTFFLIRSSYCSFVSYCFVSETQQQLERPVEDRLIDLTSLDDGLQGGGYGNCQDETSTSTVSNQVNTSLIKRCKPACCIFAMLSS